MSVTEPMSKNAAETVQFVTAVIGLVIVLGAVVSCTAQVHVKSDFAQAMSACGYLTYNSNSRETMLVGDPEYQASVRSCQERVLETFANRPTPPARSLFAVWPF